MPLFEIKYKSRIKGPISDGSIHRHVADYEADVAEALAEEGQSLMLRRLSQVLRNPTGYYESRIDTKRRSHNRYEVHDSDVVYGPWLEGTGSRNKPRPGFPGYHSFSVVEEQLKRRRGSISRKILREHRSRGRLI